MKKGSTLFLRLVIILMALLVAGLCIFLLPKGIMSDNVGYYRPLLIGMYIPALPFFFGLFQGWKLLNCIDKKKAFSVVSVDAFRKIKYCGFAISALYTLGLPYIFYVANRDDAPGVMLLGCMFVGAPLIIGTGAAIFQRLFQNVIDIKSENELTV